MTNPLYDALLAPHIGNDACFATLQDGSTLSYREFLSGVSRAAGVLRDCGLSKGDRLALQVEKSINALEIYGACLMTGVIFLPLNTAYTPDEIDYFLKDAQAGVFIGDPSREAELKPLAQWHRTRLLTLSQDGNGSFTDLARSAKPVESAAACAPDDIAALLYTSGTTGFPKGAVLLAWF